jgi:hypothetical protein
VNAFRRGELTIGSSIADQLVPQNWLTLDRSDLDLGSSGAILFDIPGARPSSYVIALGKAGAAYLADRTHLGGTGSGIETRYVSGSIRGVAAAYSTPLGTYVALNAIGNRGSPTNGCPTTGPAADLTVLKIVPGAQHTIQWAWCSVMAGHGGISVSVADAAGNEAVVWTVSATVTNDVRAFDGDTGQDLLGGHPLQISDVFSKYLAPIISNGRVFIAGNARLWALTVR